jgi:hypothetical protein
VGTCVAVLLDLVFVLGDLVYRTIGLICELVARVSAEPEGRRGVTLRRQEVRLSFSISLPKRRAFNAFDSLVA